MKDERKTKKQLIKELTELRQKITESFETDPEQKEIQHLTNEYEIRYRTLFDRSLFCVYLHDLQGNLFDANETALKLFGYTKEELSSLNILSLIPEEQRSVALQRMEEIFKTGSQKKPYEYMIKKKDGEYLWMEVEGALIVKHGKSYAIQGIARNITERKLLEEGIRESEGKYRSLYQEFHGILNAIPDALVLLSSDLKVVWSNEVAAKNMNMSLDDFIGQHCYKVRHGRPEPCEICPVLECFTSHKPNIIESTTPDGRIWELHVYPVFGEREEVKGVIEAAHNITERQRAEEVLKQHRKELIERINELEEFYKLAVGRELRMIELKKEIKQLKQQLEKYGIPLSQKTM